MKNEERQKLLREEREYKEGYRTEAIQIKRKAGRTDGRKQIEMV